MDGQNYLGVYLGKNSATVVCLKPHGKGHDIVGCFDVAVPQTEEKTPKSLVDMIAKGCAERNLKFAEVAIALDCGMFMQHKVHSEFSDIKQISTTVRFDTEEAIATDISEIAIAFNVASSDKAGSDLTVFTTQKKLLADFIAALQSSGLDPVSIEPDINCLARFLNKNLLQNEEEKPFFALLSNSRGYFIIFTDSDKTVMRTLLIGQSQQRQQLLSREIPVTNALTKGLNSVNCIKVFDSANSVNTQHLASEININTQPLDLTAAIGTTENALTGCGDMAGFAIAYGAALAHIERPYTINFRNDFMPYLGMKKRMEKTFRFVSVIASLLIVAIGYSITPDWVRTKNEYKQIRKRVELQYASIVPNGKMASGEKLEKKLERILYRIKTESKDSLTAGGEKTISVKISLVLGAFNKCASQTELEIDSIKAGKKVVTIVGTTSTTKRLLQLKDELEKVGFEVTPQYEVVAGRTKFTLTAVAK